MRPSGLLARLGLIGMTAGLGAGAMARAEKPTLPAGPDRTNVLFITADDLNYDSLGVTGCKLPGITPNLDKLAAEGMRFTRGHVTIAVCQPSRSVLMTGRYPHRNGAKGFEPIDLAVPTLGESLRAAGYLNGILGKVKHLAPQEKFCWDKVAGMEELSMGRDPQLYYQHAKAFFGRARSAGKPFFLMANSHDPHRPFAGSRQEQRRASFRKANYPRPTPLVLPADVIMPGFLPDIPDVRKEVSEYYTSVHRGDETVGAVLRALAESGAADNTLVMFLSDNGIALPFAKTNCYLHSTHTPWLVRWPGRVKPGRVDDVHFISGIDFMPTILDALDLPKIDGVDGRSFLPVLKGQPQPGRERVLTQFHQTAGKNDYPMRCVQDRKFGYIYNAWSDGEMVFKNESQSGLTFRAMQAAAKTDERIARRVKLFQYRVREELYDFEKDPDARVNLADDPAFKTVLTRMRAALKKTLAVARDPLLSVFEQQIRN